jgi:ribonuclease HI
MRANSSAKFKKFGNKKDATQFIEKHRAVKKETQRQLADPDADLNVLAGTPLFDQPKREVPQGPQTTKDKNRSTRQSSPVATYAAATALPDDLAELRKQGFMFTATDPPRLVAYTDGSSLSNGTKRACAGAGVYWGEGDAEKHNVAERVPGKLQTNNRGELLVSTA